jgi:hypothetical protein
MQGRHKKTENDLSIEERFVYIGFFVDASNLDDCLSPMPPRAARQRGVYSRNGSYDGYARAVPREPIWTV